MQFNCILDLFQLYPVTSHLNLLVSPSQILYPPILLIPRPVSCPVDPLSLLSTHPVWHIPHSRLLCLSYVPSPYSFSSYRCQSRSSFYHIAPQVAQRSPYRYPALLLSYLSVYLLLRHVVGALRRPVRIHQPH